MFFLSLLFILPRDSQIPLEQNVADKIYTVFRCFVDVEILFLSLLKKREGKLKFWVFPSALWVMPCWELTRLSWCQIDNKMFFFMFIPIKMMLCRQYQLVRTFLVIDELLLFCPILRFFLNCAIFFIPRSRTRAFSFKYYEGKKVICKVHFVHAWISCLLCSE